MMSMSKSDFNIRRGQNDSIQKSSELADETDGITAVASFNTDEYYTRCITAVDFHDIQAVKSHSHFCGNGFFYRLTPDLWQPYFYVNNTSYNPSNP